MIGVLSNCVISLNTARQCHWLLLNSLSKPKDLGLCHQSLFPLWVGFAMLVFGLSTVITLGGVRVTQATRLFKIVYIGTLSELVSSPDQIFLHALCTQGLGTFTRGLLDIRWSVVTSFGL